MRKFTDWGPAVLVLIATLVAIFAAPSMVRRVEFAQTSARVTLARQTLSEDDILVRIDQAVRRIAESVSPSVVHIDVRPTGRRFGPSSSGSGWIFDRDGHVITNSHVLRNADSVEVQLSDGRIFNAEQIGVDPLTDIAVLKLPDGVKSIMPTVRATGQQLRQGERVFAFGSPFGFKFSMSEGIVSGLGREPAGAVAAASGYTNFIQTDAAVNPGNSGGPLVNVRGQVVGMNVAIATGSESNGTNEGQSAGISFAIPLAVIESVVEQLIETGEVSRGYLGITLPRRGTEVGLVGYNGFGVRVPSVAEGGPARLAGLEPNDVILEIGGQQVTGVGVLRSLISTLQPGEQVEMRVWREGRELTLRPVLAQAGTEVTIRPSIESELQRFGLNLVTDGNEVRVRWVFNDRAAAQAGFEVGQTLHRIDGRTVRNYGHAIELFHEAGLLQGRQVEVEVEVVNEEGEVEREALRVSRQG